MTQALYHVTFLSKAESLDALKSANQRLMDLATERFDELQDCLGTMETLVESLNDPSHGATMETLVYIDTQVRAIVEKHKAKKLSPEK